MGTIDLVTYGLLFAAFLLFNFVIRQMAKRARELQEEERAQQARAAASPPEDEPLEEIWGRRPHPEATLAPVAGVPAQRAPAIGALPTASRRPARRHLLRTRQDLREAVMAMAVLGPCRALEPYGRGPEGSAGKDPAQDAGHRHARS